ncbi:hypothetical protein [Bacillus solitudinis]|uniref:hypothetical protein n=1 Tax=Bacillus solitudinis TaxID=2014074 RepID=UPI000C247F65|nr:hypothetical protein [Bacillus solitudinis]
MRSLVFKDVFTMSRILKKMQIKPEYKKSMSQEELGIEIMLKVVEGIGDAEQEVTAFLADLKGIDVGRLATFDAEETFALIEEFKEHPQVNSFLQRAIKLMK